MAAAVFKTYLSLKIKIYYILLKYTVNEGINFCFHGDYLNKFKEQENYFI